MKKTIIASLAAAMLSASVMAQNIGFEDGNTTGWGGNGISAVGSQTLQAGQNQWTVNPYGNYMGKLSISSGSFSQMTNALSLTSTSASGIQSTLSTQASSTGFGQGNPTTAAWASKTVTLTAGQNFSLAWQYISTDYVPFNDGSIATLVKVGSPNVNAVLNNYTSQYALLGFTNPGTGDYSTGSYGSTGWQTATYTVTEGGEYLLGFGVFNLDDNALSPVLYVDEVIGTTLQNGQTFGAVAPNPGTLAPTTPAEPVTPPTPPAPTIVSSAAGTPIVSTSTATGPTTTDVAVTAGVTAIVTTITDTRTGQSKILSINRNATAVATTPVTTTVTSTTPVTTTTTTTPTIVNTYSDGTTQTVNGTPTTSVTNSSQVTVATNTVDDVQTASQDKSYSTRIDQYDYMSKANTRINMTLDSNVLDRHDGKDTVISSRTGLAGTEEKGWTYIVAEGQRSNTSDTYKMNTSRFGVGHEKKIESNWIVGGQYNNVIANLSGDQSGGRLEKNHVGVYSLYNMDGWLLKSDLGLAHNTYSNYHSINELGMNNTGKTNGTDVWLANRLYTPSLEGVRPFAGVRVQNSTIGAVTESGTPLTAMTYGKQNQTNTIGEAGIRYDMRVADAVNLTAEAAQTTNNITTVKVGASAAPEKNVLANINIAQQRQDSVVNNIVQATIKWFF
jgi:hypothetical protein